MRMICKTRISELSVLGMMQTKPPVWGKGGGARGSNRWDPRRRMLTYRSISRQPEDPQRNRQNETDRDRNGSRARLPQHPTYDANQPLEPTETPLDPLQTVLFPSKISLFAFPLLELDATCSFSSILAKAAFFLPDFVGDLVEAFGCGPKRRSEVGNVRGRR